MTVVKSAAFVAILIATLSLSGTAQAQADACFMEAGQKAADEGYTPGTAAWQQEAASIAVEDCNLSNAGGSNYTEHQLELYFAKLCSSPGRCYASN